MSQKLKEHVCASWADLVYSSTISIFAREGNLDGTFLNVGPSLDWGVLTPGENERVYNEYGYCAILLYECIFSILGLRIPCNGFKMEVLKNLMVSSSQLHPTS